MFNATKDTQLPTAMVGSFPKPTWFTESLRGRPFKVAMGDSVYREQYIDAVACYVNEQEQAGLDIFTDGDTRFDLEVGGRSRVAHEPLPDAPTRRALGNRDGDAAAPKQAAQLAGKRQFRSTNHLLSSSRRSLSARARFQGDTRWWRVAH